MRRWSRLVCFTVALALASYLAVMPSFAQKPITKPDIPGGIRRVTLDLKSVPLADAIRQVIAATNLSVVVSSELPKEPRVTMRLVDADPVTILQLLGKMGNLRVDGARTTQTRGKATTQRH